MSQTLGDFQNYLNEISMVQNGEEFQRGWEEALDMVLGVIEQMQDSMDFHNPTLDEVEQRIV
jgi:hypothetical protein